MKLRHKTLIMLGITGVLLAIYAFGIEPNMLTVRQKTLAVPGWTEPLDGLRVAVIADLHVGSSFIDLEKVEEVVQRTNELQPDVVLMLGDFLIDDVIGGTFFEPEPISERLEKLKSTYGTYTILGNHDWMFDGGRMRTALIDAGIVVLENRSVRVGDPDNHFWVSGIDDLWEREPDLDLTLKMVTDDQPVLLLTHNPDVFVDVPARVSLTLAGHTHGGQVNLPIIGRPMVPSKYGQRFAVGHIVEEGRHMFVGTGIGTSILPVRFGVVPEIVVLTLTSG